MSTTFKFGNKNWAWKEGSVLAYNDENNNFKPLPFTFTRSSSATRVNKDGLIEVVGTDEPRVDYLNNADGHLLLEPSRSNNVPNSDDFGAATWSLLGLGVASTPTITSNYAISPDGTQNADRIQFNLNGGTTTSDRAIIRYGTLTAQTDYYLSCYIKSTDGSEQKLLWHTGGDDFEFTVTNEWQRFELSRNGSLISNAGLSLRGAISSVDTADVLVYGFQVEQGSYATSYIPTSGSSVTRAVDAASQTPPSGIIGQTEGTLFLDFVPLNNPESGIGKWMFFLGNGTAYITILLTSNGKIRGNVSNTTSQCAIDTTYDWQKGVRYKAALAYKENDFAMYVNGSLIGTDVLGTIPSTSLITTQYNTTPANANNYLLNNAVLYNTRLSNAELATLTSL